jgi:hypothetical protein
MDDPTIYDYVVALFNAKKKIALPPNISHPPTGEISDLPAEENRTNTQERVRVVVGCLLAVGGQFFLEPGSRSLLLAFPLYFVSLWLIWPFAGVQRHAKRETNTGLDDIEVNVLALSVALISMLIALMLFGGNTFTVINILFWLVAIIAMTIAFWSKAKPNKSELKRHSRTFIITVILTAVIIIFFRVYQIQPVPSEMYSDHAEKLLDVMDILAGKFSIFFERNTGREPLQFYVTALIVRLFNTGFSFLSLKIGTIFFSLATLPFIYLIGRELQDEWTGLAAVFFAGIAYWPNVISRVALRYALYPLFAAPALYFLMRGLRQKRINNFILCGIFIGLGLHGYSAFRIIPLYVALILLLFGITKKKGFDFPRSFFTLFVIGAVALAIFLPLLRYWFDHPGMFSYRMLTRLAPVERSFDTSPLLVFIKNSISSLLMPFWNNGQIWVHSIPNRPALDFISGGFYFVGLASMIKQSIRNKDPYLAALIISIPVFMLPSILSLAYPGENPSLNRSAAAYVPIFIVAGYGFFIFIHTLKSFFKPRIGSTAAVVCTLLFCGLASINNYRLVFEEYKSQYNQKAWNTSEIGKVVNEFLDGADSSRHAYVVPYPHWVDTRLVGFNAGFPGRDFALWQEDLEITQNDSGEKVFLFKPEDSETQKILQELYPQGTYAIFYSRVSGREFIIYTVLDE